MDNTAAMVQPLRLDGFPADFPSGITPRDLPLWMDRLMEGAWLAADWNAAPLLP